MIVLPWNTKSSFFFFFWLDEYNYLKAMQKPWHTIVGNEFRLGPQLTYVLNYLINCWAYNTDQHCKTKFAKTY